MPSIPFFTNHSETRFISENSPIESIAPINLGICGIRYFVNLFKSTFLLNGSCFVVDIIHSFWKLRCIYAWGAAMFILFLPLPFTPLSTLLFLIVQNYLRGSFAYSGFSEDFSKLKQIFNF